MRSPEKNENPNKSTFLSLVLSQNPPEGYSADQNAEDHLPAGFDGLSLAPSSKQRSSSALGSSMASFSTNTPVYFSSPFPFAVMPLELHSVTAVLREKLKLGDVEEQMSLIAKRLAEGRAVFGLWANQLKTVEERNGTANMALLHPTKGLRFCFCFLSFFIGFSPLRRSSPAKHGRHKSFSRARVCSQAASFPLALRLLP